MSRKNLRITSGRGKLPSLAKEGWPRHQLNGPVPLQARPGWFVQLPINRWLEPTTPSAPAKEASRNFFNGRSHPSLSKEGSFAPSNFRLILNSLSSGVLNVL